MTIHFYFARKFIWVFLGISALFLALLGLVDLMDHLRHFDVEQIGFDQVLRLTLLNAPASMYQILPLLVILSAVALFLSLARSSELVVVRASGRSALVSLLSPVMVVFLMGVVSVTMLNPIVALTSSRFSELKESFDYGGRSAFSVSDQGLWLRQGSDRGQAVIHADRTNPDASYFYDVTIVLYAKDGGPVTRIEAEAAALDEGAWELYNAKAWPLHAGLNPEEGSKTHELLRVESSLTRDRIRDSFGSPAAISIWDLPEFIGDLEEAGFSARRHQVWLQMELAQPLFLVAMMMIAAAFTMRHTRAGRTGLAVLGAVMTGFGMYYVRNFAQILGENGQIPVALAAWAPPFASVMLALGLLLHMEDG
ncbi:LPS export ABC transporter permease LptG [Shimia sp. SDUM112013]|uniref:LPS export ABC transporter permease LptG n=1 Tax=Shimia sp. SDUM112013 TaxID=3136160 RepID=UPI0032EE58D5